MERQFGDRLSMPVRILSAFARGFKMSHEDLLRFRRGLSSTEDTLQKLREMAAATREIPMSQRPWEVPYTRRGGSCIDYENPNFIVVRAYARARMNQNDSNH